ncbi:hypothetical protein AX16_003140 [Volvariella volvacea WC 439]|nr:hypothetical protein AX16_003140 [Volvariella volvacea WC 439]
MCVLTMDENTFVLLDDPAAPSRADVLAAAPQGQESLYLQGPPHFRSTFITVKPRHALDQLLSQLRPRWISVRSGPTTGTQGAQAGPQLIVEGYVFSIGTDWLVRAGNVMLAGGGVRGLLLEVEYLPCPALASDGMDTPELLSNLLTSLLPTGMNDKILALTFGDEQWEELLWNREEEIGSQPVEEEEDCYVYGYKDVAKAQWRDWTGVDRDRRSAYLIIGALRSEGML